MGRCQHGVIGGSGHVFDRKQLGFHENHMYKTVGSLRLRKEPDEYNDADQPWMGHIVLVNLTPAFASKSYVQQLPAPVLH